MSRSYLQSRITLPFSPKIPNPGRKISQTPDPEKPIGDPQRSQTSVGDMEKPTWHAPLVLKQSLQITERSQRSLSCRLKKKKKKKRSESSEATRTHFPSYSTNKVKGNED